MPLHTFDFFEINGRPYYVGHGGLDWFLPNYDDRDVTVFGMGGGDNIFTGDGDDFIYGGDDGDNLSGGGGADYVYGEEGDDTIYTSEGEDVLDGGDGVDTLRLDSDEATGWSVDLSQGLAFRVVGNPFSFNIFGDEADGRIDVAEIANFENVTGSSRDDVIVGDDRDNVLRDDWSGVARDDDVLRGGGGNDTLIAWGGGTDELYGEDGDDRLEIWSGAKESRLDGGAGADDFVFRDWHGHDGHLATVEDFDWREGDTILLDSDFFLDTDLSDGTGIPGEMSYWVEQTGSTARLGFDNDRDQVEDYHIIVELEGPGAFLPLYDVAFF
ncbi:MAG: calcium-binding protein [Pseudomonadota bacterium]